MRLLGKEVLLRETTTERGLCQMRSKTNSPCSQQAVGEIWGVPLCRACAREQETYFAIGELTATATQAQGVVSSERELAGRIAEVGSKY